MGKDRVLIVAETQESAETLRKRLFEAAKQAIPTEGGAMLTIKTKYFTVTVEVIVCARSAVGELAERERVDALVMSDLECPNSELETMLNLFDTQPGVSLLCCEREARKIDDATEDALRTWCIDHDTEFIDMGLRTTSERDKEGIDRVYEAMLSYPWQVDMDSDSLSAGMAARFAGMSIGGGIPDGVPSLDTVSMAAAAAEEAPAEKKTEESNTEEKTEEKVKVPEDEDDEALEDATLEKFCEELASGSKEDDELESDDFLQLMEKLSMIRSAAQRMPDAQRRQYAEQVAMAFARQMAFEDDEDEEEAKLAAEDRASAEAFDDEILRIFTQMNKDPSQKPK